MYDDNNIVSILNSWPEAAIVPRKGGREPTNAPKAVFRLDLFLRGI